MNHFNICYLFRLTTKIQRQFFAIAILIILTNGNMGLAQKTQNKPLIRQETTPTNAGGSILHGVIHYEKKLSSCDSLTLGLGFSTNSANVICYSAYPPVYSDDCLVTNQYCDFEKQVAIMTPIRDQVPFDNTNVRAITKGEKLAISVMLVARDSMSLVSILKNIEVQALINNERWVKKSMLNSADYLVSNLRSYSYSCPPQGYDKHMSDFEKYDALSQLVVSGSRPVRGSTPRPNFSESINIENMMSQPGLDGDMPNPGGAGTSSRVPVLNPKDANVLKEIAEHSLLKAKASVEAFIGKGTKCKKKVLNYWWTDIYYEYTPDLDETQLRFHINSTLSGPDNIVLGEKFNVYLAVACRHELPESDGSRKYNFILKSSSSLNLSNVTASAVYNENVLPTNPSPEHRSIATISNSVSYPAFNLNVSTASGLFPYRRNYFDDETKKDISELKCSSGDIGPIEIKGRKKVAYRFEIKSSTAGGINGLPFTSLTNDFIMPQSLSFALMGDSYSAGQGAPMFTGDPWLDNNTHRSKNSGSYRALNKFIKQSNRACDYLFIASSGAEIQDLTARAQRVGHEKDGDKMQSKSQIDSAKIWMTSKGYDHINCAIFSIGGNNSGFADIVGTVLLTPIPINGSRALSFPGQLFNEENPDLKKKVDSGFNFLDGDSGYSLINTTLKEKLKIDDVIIFNYPDMPHQRNGEVCPSDCPIPDDDIHSITKSELEYGAQILTRLNEAVASGARDNGWLLADVFKESKGFGICECNPSFYTTWGEALHLMEIAPSPTYSSSQILYLRKVCNYGNEKKIPVNSDLPGNSSSYQCSFHPTEFGYSKYINPIYDKIIGLYPN